MRIKSNDSIKLEEFYYTLKRERIDGVELKKISVDGAMGFDVILNVNIDIIVNIAEMLHTYLGYKITKLYLEKKSSKEEIKPEALENKLKDIEEDDIITVEFEER